jgi:ribosomal protein S21
MSARRNLRKKFDPILIAAKGCAKIAKIETATYGAPLPDLMREAREAEEDHIDQALKKLKEEKGIIMTRREYKKYLKMIERSGGKDQA